MRCIKPIMIKDANNYQRAVPCGKCPACRAKRVSGWSFRLMQHQKVSITSYFITLTYDTDNVPINDKGMVTLNLKDIQIFMKRLRRANPLTQISYYTVGEYGGISWRPHYHAIVFNVYDQQSFQACWDKGSVHVGHVTGASIGYTLKYISKPKRVPRFDGDTRVPEFSVMSKGIGLNYCEDLRNITWHFNALYERLYCVTEQGIKIPMPRYYRNKIYGDLIKEVTTTIEQQITNKLEMEAIIGRAKIMTNHEYDSMVEAAFRWQQLQLTHTKI